MKEVIPAILTDSAEELVRLVHIFERAGVERVHLDICDGKFVPTRTIGGLEELARLDTEIKFDVHLMVENTDRVCMDWCGSRADRLIYHVETSDDFGGMAECAAGCGKKLAAAINPETPLEKLEAAAAHTDLVQFMTVHPGRQGNQFVPEVLDNIRRFHAAHPEAAIMADGGITPETAPQCAAAGATLLVSGSYLVRSDDINAALQTLRGSVIE